MKPHRHKQLCCKRAQRSGLSLLEVTMACSLAALLMTSVVGMLHTSRQVWELTDNHSSRINSLHGTLRHASRELRSAQSLLTLESRSGYPAVLEFRDRSGQVQRWTHDPKSETVMCARGGDTGVLAEHIHSLNFQGYAADAKTPATLASGIHCVRCTATVKLKKKNDETRTAECWVWLRSQGQPNGSPPTILPSEKLAVQPAPVR
ncbi:PilW family protein [Fuerstiella marisgermanici]|uniref:Prepilin-type N-terminal cleavage/methylation domain-containing protein n=1 Tax=Fuerstiella marisgermanici TaxID=1891926 RepID=A0A1P8WKY9_9PLAN|nr:hypothetical protein [Fuerstiella marisgermanici]APZ94728.1 hypothetical protein Fuma_04367 [Fuerstiella marisgermanici]